MRSPRPLQLAMLAHQASRVAMANHQASTIKTNKEPHDFIFDITLLIIKNHYL
jgi:hypothetical protein